MPNRTFLAVITGIVCKNVPACLLGLPVLFVQLGRIRAGMFLEQLAEVRVVFVTDDLRDFENFIVSG